MLAHLTKSLRSFVVFAVLTSAQNCTPENPDSNANMICGTTKPLEELPWLKKQLLEFHGGESLNAVVLYEFDGQQILEVQNSLFSSTNQHQ